MTDSSVNSVEGLRSSIEQKERFPTAFGGFQKKAVNEYLERLNKDYGKAINTLVLDVQRKTEENNVLQNRLSMLMNSEDEIRADERKKHEAELGIQQGLVDSLRETNDRLMEENREQQLEISRLRQQLSEVSRSVSDGGNSLLSLKDSLRKMLSGKLTECEGLLSVWEKEYGDVITHVLDQNKVE